MDLSPVFNSPEEAEAAFYRAFEAADVAAMMRVWAGDGDIICIHPGGPRLDTRASIEASWTQILSRESSLRFSLRALRRSADERLAVHWVKEHISIGGIGRGVALATNVYRLTDTGWRMVLHHASPEPAGTSREASALH